MGCQIQGRPVGAVKTAGMPHRVKTILLLILSVLFTAAALRAQEQSDSLVRLEYARTAELLEINGQNVRKVIGPAQFMHNNTYLQCDTALWNVDTQVIDAIGNVSIIQDGTVLTSDKMVYYVDTDLAEFRGHVVQLEDSDHNMLRTSHLDYNTKDSVGVFDHGGSMRDKDGQIIESDKGTYDGKTKLFTFTNNVNMFTDSIFVKTTNLLYESEKNLATFGKGTDAWQDDNMLSAEAGWYDRGREVFFFRDNVHVMTDTQEGWSDTLYFFRSTMNVEMRGNAQVTDTSRNVSSMAGKMQYIDGQSKITMTRTPAVVAKLEQGEEPDTLYFGADTIVYQTLRMCDIDSVEVANSAQRVKDLDVDPVGTYRKKAAEEAAKAAEEAMKDDPNYRPQGGAQGGGKGGGPEAAPGGDRGGAPTEEEDSDDEVAAEEDIGDDAEESEEDSSGTGEANEIAGEDEAGEAAEAAGEDAAGEAAESAESDAADESAEHSIPPPRRRPGLEGENNSQEDIDQEDLDQMSEEADSLGIGMPDRGRGRGGMAGRDSLGRGRGMAGRDSLGRGRGGMAGRDSLGRGRGGMAGRDSLGRGPMQGRDSLDFAADSLGFGLDSLGFGADSLGFGADSLGFAADSLDLGPQEPLDTTKVGFVHAMGGVKVYMRDMQIVCDSLEYTDLDSLARLYKEPIIWNEIKQQYAADSVTAVIKNRALEKASLMSNSYITIEEEKEIYYNQIKSTEALAYFNDDGELTRFDALGTATCLFFLREQDDVVATVNKAESKMLYATFAGGNIQRVYYFEEAKNDAYPVVQLPKSEQMFKGFTWTPEKRPADPSAITTQTLRAPMRDQYESRPRAAFKQTDLYFPGYISDINRQIAVRDSLREVRAHERQIQAQLDEMMLQDSLSRDSLALADSLALGDSLAVGDSLALRDSVSLMRDSLRRARMDSLAVRDSLAASDSLAVGDSLAAGSVAEVHVPTKEELAAQKAAEKQAAREAKMAAREAKIAAREAKWAQLDSLDAAKAAEKQAKKDAKLRAKKLKLLQKQDKQEAKDQKKLNQYLQRLEAKGANAAAKQSKAAASATSKSAKKAAKSAAEARAAETAEEIKAVEAASSAEKIEAGEAVEAAEAASDAAEGVEAMEAAEAVEAAEESAAAEAKEAEAAEPVEEAKAARPVRILKAESADDD